MKTLSVVLSTRNEEQNIGACLESVKNIADEIIIFDEYSQDKTREIAKKFGAKVFKVKHEDIFHITKQKAINKAKSDWTLQLDADERVPEKLSKEIKSVINMSDDEILQRNPSSKKQKLFDRHQKAVEARDGKIGKNTGEVTAFFVPRLNMFLGKPLIHAGVYPDAVIRLFKKGKARLPGKSVHEQMEVDGQIAWLFNDLEHHDSPTLSRYLTRANRYTDLTAAELKAKNTPKNIFTLLFFTILKPKFVFIKLYFRHKGFLDGIRGFLWSLLSALHFPIAYWKYYTEKDDS